MSSDYKRVYVVLQSKALDDIAAVLRREEEAASPSLLTTLFSIGVGLILGAVIVKSMISGVTITYDSGSVDARSL